MFEALQTKSADKPRWCIHQYNRMLYFFSGSVVAAGVVAGCAFSAAGASVAGLFASWACVASWPAASPCMLMLPSDLKSTTSEIAAKMMKATRIFHIGVSGYLCCPAWKVSAGQQQPADKLRIRQRVIDAARRAGCRHGGSNPLRLVYQYAAAA